MMTKDEFLNNIPGEKTINSLLFWVIASGSFLAAADFYQEQFFESVMISISVLISSALYCGPEIVRLYGEMKQSNQFKVLPISQDLVTPLDENTQYNILLNSFLDCYDLINRFIADYFARNPDISSNYFKMMSEFEIPLETEFAQNETVQRFKAKKAIEARQKIDVKNTKNLKPPTDQFGAINLIVNQVDRVSALIKSSLKSQNKTGDNTILFSFLDTNLRNLYSEITPILSDSRYQKPNKLVVNNLLLLNTEIGGKIDSLDLSGDVKTLAPKMGAILDEILISTKDIISKGISIEFIKLDFENFSTNQRENIKWKSVINKDSGAIDYKGDDSLNQLLIVDQIQGLKNKLELIECFLMFLAVDLNNINDKFSLQNGIQLGKLNQIIMSFFLYKTGIENEINCLNSPQIFNRNSGIGKLDLIVNLLNKWNSKLECYINFIFPPNCDWKSEYYKTDEFFTSIQELIGFIHSLATNVLTTEN